jgi:hypothetical protein
MDRHLILTLVAFATIAGPMAGQTTERRATLLGSGISGGQGKCTVEVVVDGSADVEIQGDRGILRNVNGGPPQWVRFECTGPLPYRPTDFRFSGVDGRGSQQLVRDPQTDGIAVVRITDLQGGSEGYTFDVSWSGGSVYSTDNRRIYSSQNSVGAGQRISMDEAIRVCQDAVRQEAAQRFNTSDIEFRRASTQDNRGRRDMVAGNFVIRSGSTVSGNYGRQNLHRFSCAMNFNTGILHTVQIDQPQSGGSSALLGGDVGASSYNRQVMRACERAVQDRVQRDGYQRTAFGQMSTDSSNRIVGTVTADRGNATDLLDFACTVNANSGTIRSVAVNRQ